MIEDHWLAGVGLGRFGEFFPHYQVTSYYTRYPHNLLLEVTAEIGLFGLVFLAGFFALAIHWRFRKHSRGAGSIALVAATLLLLHSLIDIDWHAPANPILLMILLAAVVKDQSI